MADADYESASDDLGVAAVARVLLFPSSLAFCGAKLVWSTRMLRILAIRSGEVESVLQNERFFVVSARESTCGPAVRLVTKIDDFVKIATALLGATTRRRRRVVALESKNMRILAISAAASAAMIGSASATTIALTNANFEAPMVNTIIEPTYGNWSTTVSGWTASGVVNTYAPNFAGGLAYNGQSSNGNGAQVANIINGSSLSQLTTALIAGNTTYTLTADFGDRLTQTAGGSFAIFGNTVDNILIQSAITFPGEGGWLTQSLNLIVGNASNLIGQRLGVVFFGGGTQVSIDNVTLTSTPNVVVTPLPGAVWMFGSVVAGAYLTRRRKANA